MVYYHGAELGDKMLPGNIWFSYIDIPNCEKGGNNKLGLLVILYVTLTENRNWGRLRGLAVACWTTNHYHPCSNLSVGIFEGCFVFDFVSLPSEVARPI